MKYEYEEKYEKWLKDNPKIKDVMRPVIRQVPVCLPQALWTVLDHMRNDGDNVDRIVSGLIEKHMEWLLLLMVKKHETGGNN